MERCVKSGYGIYADGKWYPFDAKGNELAKAMFENADLNAIREVSRRVAITVGVDVARQCESNSRFCLNKAGDNKFVAERV